MNKYINYAKILKEALSNKQRLKSLIFNKKELKIKAKQQAYGILIKAVTHFD